ncbi:MAG: hypothetical protein KJ868_13110 [Gammaproteobacteria bacterium]|nr:hypothetical protein [Gammaproteobacteria bacterium]MBU2238940.1 hypothetical protein [Gammaproteobacteria bacterium]
MAYRKIGKSFGTFSNLDFHQTTLLQEVIEKMAPGDAIATIKCFLYMARKVHFYTRVTTVKYSELMAYTGLLKPMISRAIKILQNDLNLIKKWDKRSEFLMSKVKDERDMDRFSKVPNDNLDKNLKLIPNKGKKSKNALCMYLYFLTIRNNKEAIARVSYDRITEYLGILRNDIQPSLCILYESNLVTCISPKYGEEGSNKYHIKGLDIGKEQYVYHPSGYNRKNDDI